MTEYDAIYLSPHLDDVALSCGGQIFDRTARGESILIVTWMAGDPPASSLSEFAGLLHTRWQLAADVVAARREEDIAACRLLGADYLHWDIPDCIYRQHPLTGAYLYVSRDDIFGPVHMAEQALVSELASRCAQLPTYKAVFSPLAVGNHVDHQLTRAAAEQYWGGSLVYYEDYPYVGLESVTARAIPAADACWQAQVISLSEAGIAARIEAITAFASQVSTFFNGRSDLETKLHHQIHLVGGERIWHRETAIR